MHISDNSIDPGLRRTGKIIRTIMPSFTEKKIKAIRSMNSLSEGVNNSKFNYEQHFVTRADGSKLRLCVYSSNTPKKDVPGVLWIHGGGYAIGIPEIETVSFADLIYKLGAVVVAPDYCLSTEKPYPAALSDCYAGLEWLRQHTAEYGIRDDQLVVAGSSAGGGLTAALSLYARDKGDIAIAFQMPLYPMIDDRPTGSSIDNDAPVWNTKSNQTCWGMYLGSLYGNEHVPAYAAPARAEDLSNLPPTVSFVGDIEPFYDETVSYIEKLQNAGVPTTFKVFPGAFHAFDMLCPKAQLSQEAHEFFFDSFKYYSERYFAKQPCK